MLLKEEERKRVVEDARQQKEKADENAHKKKEKADEDARQQDEAGERRTLAVRESGRRYTRGSMTPGAGKGKQPDKKHSKTRLHSTRRRR